ncbi:MAG: hypothetical protein ABI353_19455, partial [Isosphaeraceae bacterium]
MERWIIIGTVLIAIIVILASHRPAVSDERLRLWRIERKLDLILAHLGLSFKDEVPERIARLLALGQTVEAVKVYRLITGVSLAEAREAIETFRRQLEFQAQPIDPPSLD